MSSPYRRARTRVVQSAILSPQSLSIMLVALLGFVADVAVLGLPSVLWLAIGLVGVFLFLVASFSDPSAVSRSIDRFLLRQFNPADIQNTRARQRLQQALEYAENIQNLGIQRGGAMRIQLEGTVSEVHDWLEQIYKIARRVDLYEGNSLINRDLARVPDEVKLLQQRYANESDSRVQTELQETIRLKQTQLDNLRAIEANIKRADLQLDNTVAALGTIYAQVQLLDAKDVDSRRTQRLRQDIRDEVLSLKDTIEALDDVQGANLYSAL